MHVLAIISIFSILLPSGMVFFSLRRLTIPFYFVVALVLFTLVMEGTGYLLWAKGINNMPLFHLFTFLESICIGLYYFYIYRQRPIRWFFLAMLIAFLLFSAVNLLFWEKLTHYNSIQRSVECIWTIFLFFAFYIELFTTLSVTNLSRYSHYWMTSGFLLYFAGTLFLSIVGDTYVQTDLIRFNVFNIHSILNIFLNIIYTIVLWMGSRELISER